MDLLLCLYGCLFLVGVLANGSVSFTLCLGRSSLRTRSPVLLSQVSGDFLVCCLSGPITAALYINTSWIRSWYEIALFIEAWPVAVSTLSMMTVSVDRYLTVKNYRPAGHVAGRRFLLLSVVFITWLFAAVMSTAHLIRIEPLRQVVAFLRLLLVHVVPATAVLVSYFGVHAKLTAVSLVARARHGELPLPMPLLRRPTRVIIVGVAGIRETGIVPQSPPEINRNAERDVEAAVEDTQPPPSTLSSRRRLANSLLVAAGLFFLCWAPYVIVEFCMEMDYAISDSMQDFSLLLGHIHSAISPLIYQWINRPCTLRFPGLNRSPSSTNEAALGPFNPRFVRPPPMRRRSSNYLY